MPDIVLITVDTLRADRLNAYGYEKIHTPGTSLLAEQGIVFENAIVDTTWTLPSMASVMTGKYPTEHRVQTWYDRLGDEETTLAELLKERGYQTAAVLGSYVLDRRFGFSQGFDYYDDEMQLPQVSREATAGTAPPDPGDGRKELDHWRQRREETSAYRSDDQVAESAIAWLKEHTNRESPFFLWVHFFGPHEKPHLHSARPWFQEAVAAYDPAVEFADAQVARLVQYVLKLEQRRSRSAAIIFHSDHGQSLMERGIFGHGLDLYETTARVPLICVLPRRAGRGTRVADVVRNLDIFATVLELAGMHRVPTGVSRSLLRAKGEQREAYIESYHAVDLSAGEVVVQETRMRVGPVLKGLRLQNWKLIVREPTIPWYWEDNGSRALPEGFVAAHRTVELYNLSTDPLEGKNLASEAPDQVAALMSALSKYERQQPKHRAIEQLDETTRERLRALGYLQ